MGKIPRKKEREKNGRFRWFIYLFIQLEGEGGKAAVVVVGGGGGGFRLTYHRATGHFHVRRTGLCNFSVWMNGWVELGSDALYAPIQSV